MSNFKPGDLLMVVRPTPCCGNPKDIGMIFTADSASQFWRLKCAFCLTVERRSGVNVRGKFKIAIETSRLKKIDPPAEGDSLPTRRDLEMPA